VAVVGGSGSGKSSLIRAGLIPALKGGYLLEDSSKWKICLMKPGQGPMYNFAETILKLIDPEINKDDIHTFLTQIKKEGISAIINKLTPLKKEQRFNFFLLVDQFEELFRYQMDVDNVDSITESIDFVNLILKLTEQRDFPIYIVITMRSDFIGDCTQFHGLPQALNKSQYLVPRLNRQEMKRVIEGPSKLYGKKFSPALTSKLLNDTSHVKDELPLLQHALMRIWEYEVQHDNSGELDLRDYRAVGGIKRALSIHADEALEEMTKEEVKLSKEIFKALTTVDDNGRKIRRPALLSELKALTGASGAKILGVLDHFIRDRRSFIYLQPVSDSDDQVIDISHESLIRQWRTLGDWVEEEAESASYYLQLAEATRLHQLKKKDYLTGSELVLSSDWHDRFQPTAAWAKRYKTGFENDLFERAMEFLRKSKEISLYEMAEVKFKRNARRLRNFVFLLVAGFFVSYLLIKSDEKSVKPVVLDPIQQNDLLHHGILAVSNLNNVYDSLQSTNNQDGLKKYLNEYKESLSRAENHGQGGGADTRRLNQFLSNESSIDIEILGRIDKIFSASRSDDSESSMHAFSKKVKPFINAVQLRSPYNTQISANSKLSKTETVRWFEQYWKWKNQYEIDSTTTIYLIDKIQINAIYPGFEASKLKDIFEQKRIFVVPQIPQTESNVDGVKPFHLHLMPDAVNILKPAAKDRRRTIKTITKIKGVENYLYKNPDYVEPIHIIGILLFHLLGYFVLIFTLVPVYRKLTFSPGQPSPVEIFWNKSLKTGE
jgi:hypothetical protein